MGEKLIDGVKIPSKEELLGEVETEEVNETPEETPEEKEETPEYSDVEKKAMEMGWNPEGVEGKENLNAEEFVGRQKLYDDIRTLKKQNKRLSGDIENINKYQDTIREDERKVVMQELRDRKIQALKDEDYDKVADLDDQIADERGKESQTAATTDGPTPEFKEWVSDNGWYETDIDLKVEADHIGEKYWKANPEKTLEEVFEYVGKTVRKLNPDTFDNGNRNKPSAVEASGNRPARKKETAPKYKVSDLDAESQSIMRTIIRTTKGMTEERYLKEYFES